MLVGVPLSQNRLPEGFFPRSFSDHLLHSPYGCPTIKPVPRSKGGNSNITSNSLSTSFLTSIRYGERERWQGRKCREAVKDSTHPAPTASRSPASSGSHHSPSLRPSRCSEAATADAEAVPAKSHKQFHLAQVLKEKQPFVSPTRGNATNSCYKNSHTPVRQGENMSSSPAKDTEDKALYLPPG